MPQKHTFGFHTLVVFAALAGIVFLAQLFPMTTLLQRPPQARASGGLNFLQGFAWSENIGWLSTNCNDIAGGCASVAYTVGIDSVTGLFLNGTAWSENVGWISFDPSDTAGCPAGPCQAQISNGIVSGWARMLSGQTSSGSSNSYTSASAFGTGGVVQTDVIAGNEIAQSVYTNPFNIFVAGTQSASGGGCAAGGACWRIEERDIDTGALVSGFGTNGIFSEDPSAGDDQLYSMAGGATTLYLVGSDSSTGNKEWRIEKRAQSNGAGFAAFGTSGVITENQTAGDDEAYSVAIDPSTTNIYVVGWTQAVAGNEAWRIEKRALNSGAFVAAFGTNGAIDENVTGGHDRAFSVYADGGDIYVVGQQATGAGCATGGDCWRIEKRVASTGALVAGFGTGGVVTVDPSSGDDWPFQVTGDSSYLYIAGFQGTGCTGGGECWRVEKRNKNNGALIATFGAGGVVTSDPTSSNDEIRGISIDSNYVYLTGCQNGSVGSGTACTSAGDTAIRIEKRDINTGALVNTFGSNGVIVENPSASNDKFFDIDADSGYLYGVGAQGSGCPTGGSCFLLEKRDSNTGALIASAVPSTYTYTVPAGVTSIVVKAWGGGGGGDEASGAGFITGTIPVTPGENLSVFVGGGGKGTTGGSLGGANGGGKGNASDNAGGGGGFSGIKRGSTELIIAAGSGGQPAAVSNHSGIGGGLVGGLAAASGGGFGGTQTAGGVGRACGSATSGSSLTGGQGGQNTDPDSGGGGGAGHFGGGGGCSSDGGGGGSSYVISTATATSTIAGATYINGQNDAANDADTDYSYNAGEGGTDNIQAGRPGLVVISTPAVMSDVPGGDGWISLNCSNTGTCGTSNYGVTLDSSYNFDGYAWGGDVLGWIQFNPAFGGVRLWGAITPVTIDSFTATPSSIVGGNSSTLAWTTSNATACTASGGWSGSVGTSTSQSVGPLAVSTSFTLNCTNALSSATSSVNVIVSNPADFSLNSSNSIKKSSIQVDSSASTITIGSLNGYSSTVNLSAAPAKIGGVNVNYVFSSTSLSPAQYGTGSVFYVSSTTTIPAGQYTITLTGTDGTLTHNTSVLLNVSSTTRGIQEF